MKSCPICGEPVPPNAGPSRPRIYCSDRCRLKSAARAAAQRAREATQRRREPASTGLTSKELQQIVADCRRHKAALDTVDAIASRMGEFPSDDDKRRMGDAYLSAREAAAQLSRHGLDDLSRAVVLLSEDFGKTKEGA